VALLGAPHARRVRPARSRCHKSPTKPSNPLSFSLQNRDDEGEDDATSAATTPHKSFGSAAKLREFLDRHGAAQPGEPPCAGCGKPLRGIAYRCPAPPTPPAPAIAAESAPGEDAMLSPGAAAAAAQAETEATAASSYPMMAALGPLLCQNCHFCRGGDSDAGEGAGAPVAGASLAPRPGGAGGVRADSAAESRLRTHLAALAESLAAQHARAREEAALHASTAAAASAAACGTNASSSDTSAAGSMGIDDGAQQPPSAAAEAAAAAASSRDAAATVEAVLQSLNELRLGGFAGAEALLEACVIPARSAVVAALPPSARQSTPSILLTQDLGRMPPQPLRSLAALVEAQARAFAAPPSAEEEAGFEDRWAVDAQPQPGKGGEGCLLPAPAFLQRLEAMTSSSSMAAAAAQPKKGKAATSSAASAPDAVLCWLFGVAGPGALPGAPPAGCYPPAQARAAALHAASAGAPLPPAALRRRFADALREAHGLAAERAELAALARTARSALQRLQRGFDARPEASRAPPVGGDMAGASVACMRSVLDWEDVLCAAMWVRHDADAALAQRRAGVAGEALKGAADALGAAQRGAEAARAKDEEEYRKAHRALHKLRGADGERQRAAAGEVLEQRRVLRAHELAQAQGRAQAAEERAREAAHAAEAARKQRDSLGGWRDHVRAAGDALARASAAPEGSPAHLQAMGIASQLFKTNREMFYHDQHAQQLRAELTQRARDCDAAADEIATVRPFCSVCFLFRSVLGLSVRLAGVMRSYPRFRAAPLTGWSALMHT
jgi:hypothetical protein